MAELKPFLFLYNVTKNLRCPKKTNMTSFLVFIENKIFTFLN